MITLDYSQLITAAAFAFTDDFRKGGDTNKMEGIIRHVLLKSVLMYKKLHQNKCGKIVVCCDGKDYWRREKFPYYKGHRAGKREESTTDWNSIFKISDTVREELVEVFPYKVLRVPHAEADDIIGVLAKWSQTNELIQEGLEEVPEKFMNISSDHDFRPLYKYRNYAQWSPIQKKVVPRADKTYILEKIIRGDGGDGVPNIRCADDFFANPTGMRAPAITQKFLDAFFEDPDPTKLSPELRRNYERNRLLIDLDYIPTNISDSIIEAYTSYEPKGTQQKLFDYCIKYRLKQIMSDIPAYF